MPNLKQSLFGHDHGHLLIIAEHWGISLGSSDARAAVSELVEVLLDPDLVSEVVEALPLKAIQALRALRHKNGRIPWSQFTRRFGGIREMGSGRRDRERPDRTPATAAEVLWYRALVARAFFDAPAGTVEFAYIPDDLLTLLTENTTESTAKGMTRELGRAATAAEHEAKIPATDQILDHTCTLLAALRTGIDMVPTDPYPLDFIQALVDHSGLLDTDNLPEPEATRTFLEASRGEALALLAQTWLDDPDINDLHQVPTLQPEGEWSNDPLGTRQFILSLLFALPTGTWWSLSAFIADIRQHYPDFQRPAGDYDSWYLRDTRTGQFMRGFEHWDDVDGALIRYLITGPLHWLGMMDLAGAGEDAPVSAFRLSQWALKLTEGKPPPGLAEELSRVHVRSDGRISVPVLAPRAVRYQLARFCRWEEGNPYEYRYRLTPSSLVKAQGSGLRISHLTALLRHHADAIPPNIITALDRWDERGTEVRLQDVTILRLGSPEILQALRNSRAARFLGEPLGPVTIVVKPGTGSTVLAILTEMGYLGEVIETE